MAKGLALSRAFYMAGHNVIGADFEPDAILVAGRFSRALQKFYALPKPTDQEGAAFYIQGLLNIIRAEKVDLWVSCSGVASAVEDGQAKQIVEKATDCVAVQFNVQTTSTLHEKHSFIQYTSSIGLPVPETHEVTSRTAVHKALQKAAHSGAESRGSEDGKEGPPSRKQFILKPIGVDDSARGNIMTLLPKATISETYAHVSGISISKAKPWVLQQYIRGDEYCTHALVIDSVVKCFVACPSSDLLMHYEALPVDSALGSAMLKFTEAFAARSKSANGQVGGMTGHLSFDFIVEETATEKGLEKQIYPIECNPRVHTAVVHFNHLADQMVEKYLSALAPMKFETNGFRKESGSTIEARARSALPGSIPLIPQSSPRFYWIGHDIVTLIVLPAFQFLTFKMESNAFIESVSTFIQHLLFWKDGTFEVWDPMPWWWLYHVYWPGQFLACILQGRRWSRINVSTTKVFEC